MHSAASAPIGVFDSGVGGLSVLREIRRTLPNETLYYVADSGHAPYGDKDAAYIEQRSRYIIEFLLAQGVKAVVVACNTVTGLAIQHLRAHFAQLPIVAIEPAVKPAALHTRSGVVGVLATRQTVASSGLARLVQQHGQGVRTLLQACPGWVECVERHELNSPTTIALVQQFVQPLLDQNADTLVLGCTHYPFLAPIIAALAGPDVRIIDPAAAVARQLATRLQQQGLLQTTDVDSTAQLRFWSSGTIAQAQHVISHLLSQPVMVERLPETPSTNRLI